MMACIEFLKAEFSRAYGLSSQLPPSILPEFVFAGRSNVGKSSLINKLCNRKRLARVSQTPGKTATINFYAAGDALLVDLPGYGYAKTSAQERRRWDTLINGYFAFNRNIFLLLLLLDCRRPPSGDDVSMLDYLAHYNIPFVVVLTKADKVKNSQHARTIEEFTDFLSAYNCKAILLTSSEKRTGIQDVQAVMTKALGRLEDKQGDNA